jgi:type III secretion protein V
MKNPLVRFGGDIGIGLLMFVVLALIIVPMPIIIIDMLLAVNLTVSTLLLMVVMYVPGVVSLSTFPTLLLFTTLFRLGLNIASTKLILLTADAGHVIEAFGNLVVGGNVVVGFVVFIIITLVQFIVIAKGSERVAEVGARFTLDAMPGKQMSIDADLRAGLISGELARSKRDLLGMESALHGGMDGAMKFVKGDAIAGLVITAINILGGIGIGVAYLGMTAGEAANRFTVLSIGDAMVSQIPSLLICIAAGVLVTRVADEQHCGPGSVGNEIGKQLTANPKPLVLTAVLVLSFAIIPGFPVIPFLALSGLLAGIAWKRTKGAPGGSATASAPLPALTREGSKSDAPTIQEKVRAFSSPLSIRISTDISAGLDVPAMDAAFARERDVLQASLGLPFPGVEIVIGRDFEPTRYQILVHDVPVDQGHLQPGALLMLTDDPDALRQCQAHDAACGMATSYWIAAARRRELAAVPALTHEEALARHAIAAMHRHAHLFIGIQEVQWLLDRANKDYPNLVAEALKVVPLLKVADVMRRLLEEQIPVRNIRSILESVVAWGSKEKDVLMLAEYVRVDLGRFLAHRAAAGRPLLEVILLDTELEQTVRQSIKQTPAGNFLALPPEVVGEITRSILALAGTQSQAGRAIVTSMDIRRYVRKMIEKSAAWLDVYSFQELGGHVEFRSIGRVKV